MSLCKNMIGQHRMTSNQLPIFESCLHYGLFVTKDYDKLSAHSETDYWSVFSAEQLNLVKCVST